MRVHWIVKIVFTALITGAIAWTTWTTQALYQVQQDIAIIKLMIATKVSSR